MLYAMQWYDIMNEILWDYMLSYEIPMQCYELSMLCSAIYNAKLCYYVCCKIYARTDCNVSGQPDCRVYFSLKDQSSNL